MLSYEHPEQAADLIDGLLMPGGDDFDARVFGEETHPAAELEDPRRYEFESALLRQLSPVKPVLGICYGCQMLNIAAGGNLHQHLPDLLGHNEHQAATVQPLNIDGSSRLAQILGDGAHSGLSLHHQAIHRVGSGYRVVARGQDDVIEAIEAEDPDLWRFGVQWHPERTPDIPTSQRIFAAFIRAVKESQGR